MENYILGIDFGTTFCCMSVFKDGGLIIVPNGIGERTTPSVVIFDGPDKVYVGEETLYHLSKSNSVKIYEIKRLIGKLYNEIQNMLDYFPYKIIEENNRPKIEMKFGDKIVKYFPEQIATLIFQKLISNAESFLKAKIRQVIITFPADFTEFQKRGVKHAAEQIPGIEVLKVINEPSAAVLAYGFPKKFIKNKFFPFNNNFTLVKTLGEFNQVHPMEEISRESNSTNDNEREELLNLNIININNINNQNDILRCSLINKDKELLKIIVFDFGGGTFDVSLIYVDNKNYETMGYKGDQRLGGSDFDKRLMDYCLDIFCKNNKYDINEIKSNYKCMQILKKACEETKIFLSVKTEDKIAIEDFYNSKPLCCYITRSKFEELCKDLFQRLIIPLDEILKEEKLNNTDIDEIVLVGGSSKMPKVKKIIQEKFPNIPINDQISPDEAVAYGASVYAEIVRRTDEDFWQDFTYIDKTGHAYGIETGDGTVKIIIPKGVNYPKTYREYFHNEIDYQYTFDIRVFEGEKKYSYENKLIGEFTIYGIPQKPQGEVLLEVTMTINSEQSIIVSAYVNEGNIRKNLKIERNNDYPELKNSDKLILGQNKLNNEEKKFKLIIFEYSRNFSKQKTDKDKYDLIKNYNEAIINYLNFFEKNYKDTSSEKYLFLLEKLFKSYTYFFNTSIKVLINLEEKNEIKKSIQSFLQKISVKAPFRIKQLLNHFKKVKNENFLERLDIFVFSMELLFNKALENFNTKEKNHIIYSKTLFEECLIISQSFIKNEEQAKMHFDLINKYKQILEDCDKKLKYISAISLSIIDQLKSQGKLFNNENNLGKEDLNFLSFNLELALKKINSIENLNENEDALETKSFYLANIVKIEFLKKEKNSDIKRLEQYAFESISIANNLKKNCKDKPWYIEINEILKKMQNTPPAPPVNIDIFDLDQKFFNLLNKGNEELLRYILKNFPYNGYNFTEETIEEYKKDKNKRKQFLNNLRKKYNFKKCSVNSLSADNNNNLSEINDKILEYIDKMIANLNNEK